MKWRLLLLVFGLIVLLLPGALFLIRPVAKFRGVEKWLPPQVSAPAPVPPKAQMSLGYHAPLGLLILDCSGSMKDNDPRFRQSLASEVFAYFFSSLIADDTAPTSREKIHFATVVYPMLASLRGRLEQPPKTNAAALRWPDKNGLRWLNLGGASTATRVDSIATTFRELMGEPGHELRNGGSTPYDAAFAATQMLIRDYRAAFGQNAEVFAVFMTDFDSGGQERVLHGIQGVHVESCHLLSPAEADQQIPRFLAAFQLEESEATSDFLGGGFDIRAFGDRPVPVLMDSDRMPKLTTEDGQAVEVRGRDGIFYAVCDPRDPRFAASRLLRVSGGGKPSRVRVFRRPCWELALKPHFYDLLSNDPPPRISLIYRSALPPAEQTPKSVQVLNKAGRKVADVTLSYDSGTGSFIGLLPSRDAFSGKDEDYTVTANTAGQTLEFPFKVMRYLRLRFRHRESGAENLQIESAPYFPMQRQP